MIQDLWKYLDVLVPDYLVSNTPYYLFKKLRSNPVLSQLARDNSPEQLEAAFQGATGKNKKERTALDIVQAYACIIALSLKDYAEGKSVLDRLPVTRLDWGLDIRNISLKKAVPESLLTVAIGYKVPTPCPLVSASSTAVFITAKPLVPTRQEPH